MNKNTIITIIAVVLVGLSLGFYFTNKNKPENISPVIPVPVAQATFLCKDNKTIEATFYEERRNSSRAGRDANSYW